MEEELRSACDDALFSASLALDGALVDDIGIRRLRSHLDACPACARFVARMGLAAALLRRAPLEPFRCELPRARLARLPSATRGLPWATAAVAVAALAFAGVSPTQRGDPRDRLDQALSASGAYRHSVVPFRLPIGQRSAADDFVAGSGASGAAGGRAGGAPRDERLR